MLAISSYCFERLGKQFGHKIQWDRGKNASRVGELRKTLNRCCPTFSPYRKFGIPSISPSRSRFSLFSCFLISLLLRWLWVRRRESQRDQMQSVNYQNLHIREAQAQTCHYLPDWLTFMASDTSQGTLHTCKESSLIFKILFPKWTSGYF